MTKFLLTITTIWQWCFAYVLIITISGCGLYFENVAMGHFPHVLAQKPLHGKVNIKKWWVYCDSADRYFSKNDPKLMKKVEVELTRALTESGIIVAVKTEEAADITIDASFSIRAYNDSDASIVFRTITKYLFVPIFFGLPTSRMDYNAEATFTVFAKNGKEIFHQISRDERHKYLGLYYGYIHALSPLKYTLKSLVSQFVDSFHYNYPALREDIQAAIVPVAGVHAAR